MVDSKYDWSTGAYEQVFTAHPEWQGKVLADLNFELPAHAHSSRDAIRCTYEYADFLKKFADEIAVPEDAYPDGLTVLAPIETWSDDFSMAIAGIPSTVNDFSAGPLWRHIIIRSMIMKRFIRKMSTGFTMNSIQDFC